ncbi:MAG: methyltransferase domain-containing protein [Bacteroidota bacterium]|nr:methyltransferase domain-containing protein [Bacteroidota bacterium]
MSTCCQGSGQCEPANKFFSKISKRYARRFHRKGAAKEQRLLLEGIRREPSQGKTVLDIGCGVGALHLSLLKEGAAFATGIDAAEGMVKKAQQLAEEFGVAEKTSYINGDFVDHAEQLHDAEITMLDKVVCCYEDVGTLIKKSTRKTAGTYALTHPKENLLTQALFKLHIALAKLFHWKFHPFWHDWQRMREMIIGEGFTCIYDNATFSWRVLVYKRV